MAIYKLPSGKFTPEYISWIAMKQRCLNPNTEKFKTYGAKGITICQRWIDSFDAFYADMGPRPKGTTIDRKETNGNYEPDNCRWATAKEQANNRNPFDNVNTLKKECPAGHPYSGENLRITASGDRKCRQCEYNHSVTRRLNAPAIARPPKPPRTHCSNGHELIPENVRVKGNVVRCKVCQRDVARNQRNKVEGL